MELKDKIIIVTGGSGLIGRQLVSYIRQSGGMAINAEISVDTDLGKGNIHCDITCLLYTSPSPRDCS